MPGNTARFGLSVSPPSLSAVLVCAGLLTLAPSPAGAEIVEVSFELPVRAGIDLHDYSTIAVLPFLVPAADGEEKVEFRGVDVEGEFDRYLRRLLRRNTKLKILEAGRFDYPTYDLMDLATDSDFWRYLGETTQADLLVSGSLDFDIHDRSGYRTEPIFFQDQLILRQVLVELAGYEYDIVILVVDGSSGKPLYADNFKDFRQFEAAKVEPLAGMFENLRALERRVAGVFSQQSMTASRVLMTN
jgi:hypothetical protein